MNGNHKATLAAVTVAAALMQPVAWSSEEAGNVASGKALAEEHCTRCHDISADGPFKLHPPSFASIAVYRSAEQIEGRIQFPSLHSAMPQMAYFMTPENIQDLVAYIVSLDKSK